MCSLFTLVESNEALASKITPFPHVDSSIRPVSRSLWSEDDELSKAIKVSAAAKKVIGIIYLATSPLSDSPEPGQVGELNLGIVLHAAHRGKGYAREAIQLVMKHAFDDRHCHRIQASLLQLSSKDLMLSLLTRLYVYHTTFSADAADDSPQAVRPRGHQAAVVLQPHDGGMAGRDDARYPGH